MHFFKHRSIHRGGEGDEAVIAANTSVCLYYMCITLSSLQSLMLVCMRFLMIIAALNCLFFFHKARVKTLFLNLFIYIYYINILFTIKLCDFVCKRERVNIILYVFICARVCTVNFKYLRCNYIIFG
jgi:hypothetical protein